MENSGKNRSWPYSIYDILPVGNVEAAKNALGVWDVHLETDERAIETNGIVEDQSGIHM